MKRMFQYLFLSAFDAYICGLQSEVKKQINSHIILFARTQFSYILMINSNKKIKLHNVYCKSYSLLFEPVITPNKVIITIILIQISIDTHLFKPLQDNQSNIWLAKKESEEYEENIKQLPDDYDHTQKDSGIIFIFYIQNFQPLSNVCSTHWAKSGVEFRHYTRNVFKLDDACGAECLKFNTRFPLALQL